MVSVLLVQKYFPHDCSTDSSSCSEQKIKESDKKYQNKTATRQRRDSVTVSNAIARKIDTPLSFPIHWARSLAAAASAVVPNPVDTLYILRRRLSSHCRFLLPRHRAPAASVIVFDTSDASYIPRLPPTPPSSALSPQTCPPPPTVPSLSVTWDRKHTSASAIREVLSSASSLLLPPLTPLSSL